MRIWLSLSGLVAACAVTSLLLISSGSHAADHGDSSSVTTVAGTDIADLYAWEDSGNLIAIMTVPTATAFSDATLYTFHIQSQDDLLAPTNPVENHTVICQFEADQTIHCWLGDQYLTGDATATAGIDNGTGLRVFAGMRDDPFFFNATGFVATVEAVLAAAGGLTFDAAGCPALDGATSGVLLTQLETEVGGGTAIDDFAGDNVLAIVAEIDLDLIDGGGNVIGVWASTNEIGN